MNTTYLNFIDDVKSDYYPTIFAKLIPIDAKQPKDILTYDLAYRQPVTFGYVIKHAAAHISSDYLAFSFFRFDIPAINEDENGIMFVMKLQDIDIIIGAIVKRELLSKADEDFSYLALHKLQDKLKTEYIEIDEIDANGLKALMNEIEALEIQKFTANRKRFVYYTFTDNERDLVKPKTTSVNADYICLSNSLRKDYNGWTVVKCGLTKQYVMTHPHMMFAGKDMTAWCSPSTIITSMPDDIYRLLGKDDYFLMANDAEATCVYSVTRNKYLKIQNFLVLEEFPANAGLVSDFAIMMKQSDARAKKALEILYEAMIKTGQSDARLLLNYAIWKAKGKYLSMPMALMNLRFFSR